MKKVKSIIDFGNGEIIDRINFELAKVVENINNLSTDDKPRKITIDISLTPTSNRRAIAIKTTVKTKVSPIVPVDTQMVIQQNGDKVVAFEADGIGDGQIDIFGEAHEVKYIDLGNDDDKVEVKSNE